MFPHLPVMSIGMVGRQIGRMWVLKVMLWILISLGLVFEQEDNRIVNS
jgi:hypothetical protein